MVWQWVCVIAIILLAIAAVVRRAYLRSRHRNTSADCGEDGFGAPDCSGCPVKEHCQKSTTSKK